MSTTLQIISVLPQTRDTMRLSLVSVALLFGARQAAGHAIFQEFWIDGVDQISDLLPRHCSFD